MNDAFHAPPLTVPSIFANGQSKRESTKMASAYFNFERRNAPKLERGRPITVRDWPLVHPFNGRRAAVKTGYKSVHFSFDGCPLSCYISGSVTATARHFACKVVCQGTSPFGNPGQQDRWYGDFSGGIPPFVVSSLFHGLRVVACKRT